MLSVQKPAQFKLLKNGETSGQSHLDFSVCTPRYMGGKKKTGLKFSSDFDNLHDQWKMSAPESKWNENPAGG